MIAIVLITVLIIALFVFMIFILVRRPHMEAMKKLMEAAGGTLNRKGEGILTLEGRQVHVQYAPPSKNSPPKLTLYTCADFRAELLVRYETKLDKFLKECGLNRELQIADRDMNDRLYFECEDQVFLDRLFADRAVKAHLFDLLRVYAAVEVTGKRCSLRKYPAPNLSQISKEEVLMSAQALVEFADRVQKTYPDAPPPIVFKAKAALLYGIGSAVLAAGIVAFVVADSSFRVVDGLRLWNTAVVAGGAATLLAVTCAFYFIKGFSTSAKPFSYFILTFLAGAMLCGRYGTAVYNGLHDSSAPMSFEQTVVNKHITQHKRSRTYHVAVAAWRPNMPVWDFTVQSGAYAPIQPGITKFSITTKAGKLGYEWVVSQNMIVAEAAAPAAITAANWPSKDYSSWYPLPSGNGKVEAQEMAFWQQWLPVIQDGITNRMNMHEVLEAAHPVEAYTALGDEYVRRQEEVLARFAALVPPERLKAFQDLVISAGRDQMAFYKEQVAHKAVDPRATIDRGSAYLKSSDKSLWDAYHYFQSLYPDCAQDFNDAIERRLAWFDII